MEASPVRHALALAILAACGGSGAGTPAPRPPSSLAVSVAGGPGTVSGLSDSPCTTSCKAEFGAGTIVHLAAAGRFRGWGGECTGAGPTCAVTVEGPMSVIANFAPAISVTLQTSAGWVRFGETGHFIASVTNADDPTVDWSVAEGPSGGVISAAGLYTAPPVAGRFHVVAASHQDPSKTAVAEVAVQAPGVQSVGYQLRPDHAGQMTFPAPLSFPSAPAWTATFKGDVSYPIIAGGKVFVTVAETGDPFTLGTRLYALDAATGAVVWGPFTDINDEGSSNAVYDDGKLFVVDGLGLLTQLDAETGAIGFQVFLPDEFTVSGPPVASDGVLFVNGGILFGGNLSAISESEGATLWTASVENGGGGAPTLSGTTVFASYPGQYYAFDRRTGATIWHFSGNMEGGGGKTSVFRDGRLYVRDVESRTQLPTSGVVLDDANGSAVGSFESTPPPVIGHQRAVLAGGSARGVDLATGATLWTFIPPRQEVVSAPIEVNGIVFVGTDQGVVYGLDGTTGAVVWTAHAASIFHPPNDDGGPPLVGFGAGEGLLVAPTENFLTAWKLQ